MNYQTEEIESKNIDHLGIIAGIIDEIGIVEKINEIFSIDIREKVNTGEVVKAIILNGLGFVSRPLYLFPDFFKDKAVEHLIGTGIKAEDLNDDKIGRVMDKLYKYGLTKLFLIIALEVVKKYGIDTKYSHLDSSSLHLHGEYKNCVNNLEKELGINREHPIMITQGYSRDHRPDLKQCILDLIVSSDGDIPLFFRGASGNESDKAVFAHILVEYSKQIDFESIMVADSALYSESNLKLMSNMKWISRVPLSIKKAKNLVKASIKNEMKACKIKGYSYIEEKVSYGGIEQRWLLVESVERKKADLNKLDKKIQEELLKANKQVDKLEQEEFADKSLAELKIKEITAKLKYHQISDYRITETLNQGKTAVYRVKCKLRENQELITQQQNSCGRFILATNILDAQELESEEILKIYKEQQSTERGFRFIKDPLFFADSLFVKNPQRVETMMMLMALCLLVYNLGQRQLRMSLKAQKATVKNQLNKPTESPTLRWIFQCFQGIHLLMAQGFQRILNLTESHCHILQFLPTTCQKYYLLS
ncbi:IS1634 family transposase [Sphaerospermopsis sp. LEGE 08334]|jgi:transposase|uniref:IS1634 family transposase n=1 Tax=Sphaerospermopsis sp. LEGE 08334 TaxID=1828651 RepID=UPI00187FF704|nr:IS1634 family transposase [Sphaerospermopsis sp. LEGE 08334]MBE9059363.1 IS1634 family transposase [Sphaerospermopsis sp. LEGE 08334]